VDSLLQTQPDLVRPWRRATLVASVIAAIELVLLIGAAALLVARPLSHAIRRHAETAALAPPKHAKAPIRKRAVQPPVGKARPRSHVRIMVFNGNGRAGAAASEASRLHTLGYLVSGTGNARRQDYATSVVMYRPGYRAEGLRLARDLQVKVVGPLDGIHQGALMGGQLAVVIGA
jgi:hypothetical protein